MTQLSRTLTLLIVIAATNAAIGQGNFKKGDTWEYAYQKNAYSYYGPTPYDQATDTMIGKITLRLDSVVQRPDSALWYMHIHDSVSVWEKKGAPGGYKYITTNLKIDSTYGQIVATAPGRDTTVHWEYSMGLTPTGISSEFVAFVRQADTLMSWTESGCLPVCTTAIYRKTNVGICAANGNNYELLTREIDKLFTQGDLINGSDDNIVISWSDSVGLCRKILLNSFINPVSEGPQKPKNGSNYERFNLVKHNGVAIAIQPAGVRPIGFSRPRALGFPKNAPVYFDLRGRRLEGQFVRFRNHGIVIRRFLNGQSDLKCIVR